MKHLKSKFLIFNSIVFLGFPFFYPLFQMSLLNVPSENVFHFYKTFSFWIFCSLAILTGYAFHEMKRWCWNLFLFVSFLFSYANALVLIKYSASQNKWVTFFVSILIQIAWIYRVSREIKVPYFLPQIKWWQSNPRYKTSVKVEILRGESENLNNHPQQQFGEILDISLGGCFIKSRLDFNENEKIKIKFTLFNVSLDITGIIVWRSKSTVTHPKGGGLKFDPLSKIQNKLLKQCLKNLRAFNQIQNAKERMSPEEFSRKLNQLNQTRLTGIEKSNEENSIESKKTKVS